MRPALQLAMMMGVENYFEKCVLFSPAAKKTKGPNNLSVSLKAKQLATMITPTNFMNSTTFLARITLACQCIQHKSLINDSVMTDECKEVQFSRHTVIEGQVISARGTIHPVFWTKLMVSN